MSSRLERLWQEAGEHAGWAPATDGLVTALHELERYASRLRPDLGRRDWQSRSPAAVPAQRSMPVSTSTRS